MKSPCNRSPNLLCSLATLLWVMNLQRVDRELGWHYKQGAWQGHKPFSGWDLGYQEDPGQTHFLQLSLTDPLPMGSADIVMTNVRCYYDDPQQGSALVRANRWFEIYPEVIQIE